MANAKPYDIFQDATEQVQSTMLAAIDNARRLLIAGQLRAIVVIPVPNQVVPHCDVLSCGPTETIVHQLERVKRATLNSEAQYEAQMGTQAITFGVVTPKS